MMFQLYPEKPIRVGDEWEREVKTAMAGLDMKVLGKYTLISVKDSVATIKMDGKYIADGKMAEGMEMKMDGTQTGEVNLKLADGYLKNSQIKIDLDGSMKVMGQNVPVKMKGNYIIKGD
jgi:LEA14-like dessication related protein